MHSPGEDLVQKWWLFEYLYVVCHLKQSSFVRTKPLKRMFFYFQYLRHLDDVPDHLLSLSPHLKRVRKVRKVYRLP